MKKVISILFSAVLVFTVVFGTTPVSALGVTPELSNSFIQTQNQKPVKVSGDIRTDYTNPSEYPLVAPGSVIGVLLDSLNSYQGFGFVDITNYDTNNMSINLVTSCDYSYAKDCYTFLEFLTLNSSGTLDFEGYTYFDTSGETDLLLHCYIPKANFANQQYIYIRLGLCNSLSSEYYSDVVTFKVTNPYYSSVPSAPTGLTCTSKTDKSATLSWNSVSGATGYNVYKGTTKLTSSPITATTYTATGLTQNTNYSFTVKAVNSKGESSASSPLSVTTNATPTVPNAPTGLTCTGYTDKTASLSWNSVTNATGYNVYKGTTKVTSSPITDTSYIVSGLAQNTSYTFTVKAVNAVGESAASSSITVKTAAVPSAPTGLTCTAKTDVTATLTWNTVTGATGYNVYNGTTKLTYSPIPGNGYIVTGLTQQTTYSFTVKAVNEYGESTASSAVSVTTEKTNIIGFTVSNEAGEAGGLVTVSVSITPGSKMSAGTFNVPFNSNLLEFVSATPGSALSSGITDINYDSVNSKIIMGYMSTQPLTAGGTILTIQFRIKSGVANQTIPVNFNVQEVLDENFNNIQNTTTQGSILVTKVVLGDVNNDGQITSADALKVLQAASGKTALTSLEKLAADVNKDGKVTAVDALMILQFATGKIQSF